MCASRLTAAALPLSHISEGGAESTCITGTTLNVDGGFET